MDLADFLPNGFRVVKGQMETSEPLVLTIDDEPVLVLQSFEGYREHLADDTPEEPPIQ